MAVSIFYAALQFSLSLALSVLCVFFGLGAFDRLTRGIDEMKEIKKGNLAVGIVVGAIIISIALFVSGPIVNFAYSIGPQYPLYAIGASLLKVGMALALAILSIYVSFSVLDSLTRDIEEVAELKKGNVAVALLIASVVLAVSLIASRALEAALY